MDETVKNFIRSQTESLMGIHRLDHHNPKDDHNPSRTHHSTEIAGLRKRMEGNIEYNWRCPCCNSIKIEKGPIPIYLQCKYCDWKGSTLPEDITS